MTKVLTAVVVAALVMVALVGGAALAVEGRLGPRPGHDPESSADLGHVLASRAQGMMPEVTVSAEMPRLVMPTVEVHAVRMVAMSGSDLRVF